MQEIKDLFLNLDKQLERVDSNLLDNYVGINEGQAIPSVLDVVMVDVYGAKTPLQQISSINREGAKSLLVSPYDVNQIKIIEQAITNANLGLSVSSFSAGVRVTFPPITEENRTELQKMAKEKFEDAKNKIKPHREKIINEIKKLEKAGMSKDDHYQAKQDLQKKIDDFISKLQERCDKKIQALSL